MGLPEILCRCGGTSRIFDVFEGPIENGALLMVGATDTSVGARGAPEIRQESERCSRGDAPEIRDGSEGLIVPEASEV